MGLTDLQCLDIEKSEEKILNLSTERKLARVLLQKCPKRSLLDSPGQLRPKESLSLGPDPKSNIVFELRGIAARLSEISDIFNKRPLSADPRNSSELFQSAQDFSFEERHSISGSFDKLKVDDFEPFDPVECSSQVTFDDLCNKTWRPSIGLGSATSPKRTEGARRLADTSASSSESGKTMNLDGVSDVRRLSLQSIAQILSDRINPRMVIDRLLEMNKEGKDSVAPSEKGFREKKAEDTIGSDGRSEKGSTRRRKSDEKLQISTKPQGVTRCLVGALTLAEIEVRNNSLKWYTVSIRAHEVQGYEKDVELILPDEATLLPPSEDGILRVGVKMNKPWKSVTVTCPLVAVDVVSRKKSILNHSMCFVSEENKLRVSCPKGEDELSFGDVLEEGTKTLDIKIYNGNEIEVVVNLRIFQMETAFSIAIPERGGFREDETGGATEFSLKPKESVTRSVVFQGVHLGTLNTLPVSGKLDVVMIVDNEEHMKKEILLWGRVGRPRIQPTGATFPLVVPRGQSKSLFLTNEGTITAVVTSTVISSIGSISEDSTDTLNPDFSVSPDKIVIEPGKKRCIFITYNPKNGLVLERCSSLKVDTGSQFHVYPIEGIESQTPNDRRSTTTQLPTLPSTGSQRRVSLGNSSTDAQDPDSVMPIRATHSELIWPSVALGSTVPKEFVIRNMSGHKLRLTATIEGPEDFRFLRNGHQTVPSLALTLQGFETKTLTVEFRPQVIGACVAKIVFKPRGESERRPAKMVRLRGYRGQAKLNLLETLRDQGGQPWLSLARANEDHYFEAKLRLKNSGDLAAYAKLELVPRSFDPEVQQTWHLEPQECVLAPQQSRWVSVRFRPRKVDLELAQGPAATYLATLRITHGDEPSRWRLRRVCEEMERRGELAGRDEAFKKLVASLCRIFPEERPVEDVGLVRDSSKQLPELCLEIQKREVALVLEQMALDESHSVWSDGMDETVVFQSIFSDSCGDVTLKAVP